VRWPGKHGEKDYRVELGGIYPTLGELLFVFGGAFLAEDRYDRPWQHKRLWYLDHLRGVVQATSMDETLAIAERATASVADRGQRGPLGFTTCAKGGTNDCKSLCPECFKAGFRLPDEVVRETLRYWGTSEAEIEKFVAKVRLP
jgi:hypothetical protein